jgi:hypothetical protein
VSFFEGILALGFAAFLFRHTYLALRQTPMPKWISTDGKEVLTVLVILTLGTVGAALVLREVLLHLPT